MNNEMKEFDPEETIHETTGRFGVYRKNREFILKKVNYYQVLFKLNLPVNRTLFDVTFAKFKSKEDFDSRNESDNITFHSFIEDSAEEREE